MFKGSKLPRKAAVGGSDAFERLVADYEKYIFNVAYRMLGNAEDAKDASQETFIKIYKNLDRYTDIQSPKGWITTVTSNACIDLLRRKKRFNDLSLEAETETEEGSVTMQLPSDSLTPEDAAVYKELRSDISAALGRLPDAYRVLVVMRDIYGYSYNEIAVAMGMQLGTVKSRLSRARGQLRTLLIKQEPNTIPNV